MVKLWSSDYRMCHHSFKHCPSQDEPRMCLEVLNQIMEEVPTFETPLNYNSEDSGQSPNIININKYPAFFSWSEACYWKNFILHYLCDGWNDPNYSITNLFSYQGTVLLITISRPKPNSENNSEYVYTVVYTHDIDQDGRYTLSFCGKQIWREWTHWLVLILAYWAMINRHYPIYNQYMIKLNFFIQLNE